MPPNIVRPHSPPSNLKPKPCSMLISSRFAMNHYHHHHRQSSPPFLTSDIFRSEVDLQIWFYFTKDFLTFYRRYHITTTAYHHRYHWYFSQGVRCTNQLRFYVYCSYRPYVCYAHSVFDKMNHLVFSSLICYLVEKFIDNSSRNNVQTRCLMKCLNEKIVYFKLWIRV